MKESNLERALEQLIKVFEKSSYHHFVYKEYDFSLTLLKNTTPMITSPFIDFKKEELMKQDKIFHSILSSEVGIFYIENSLIIGHSVSQGQILGKIKFLDLEVPIICDVNGVLVQICVHDHEMVDFHKLLFIVEVLN